MVFLRKGTVDVFIKYDMSQNMILYRLRFSKKKSLQQQKALEKRVFAIKDPAQCVRFWCTQYFN